MTSSGRRVAVVGAILALALLAACDYATDPSPDPSTTSTTATGSPSPTEVEPSETGTSSSAPAEPTSPAEEDLPGEPLDGFPEAGTSLAIVNVGAQEILNLRIGPGIDFAAIARLTPDTPLVATGRNRDLGGGAGIWYQVRAGDDVGWVISSYVAELGASRDVTDRFDPPPTSVDRGRLIEAVVRAWGGGDFEVVDGPVVIDDLQVRIDVLDGDGESVLGSRLFVVASTDGERFTVTRVTATQLCARGVSGTGECV